MNLGIATEVIETTVMVEVIIILLLIFLTYFTKLTLYLREKRKQKLITEIETHLNNLITTKQSLSSQKFKRRWKKLQILYPIFLKYNETYKGSPAWDSLRRDLLQSILLPLARKRATSRRWILRFFSCEVLALACDRTDEKIILRLVKDKVPLVYLHAISAAIKCGSDKAINTIITRMSKMSWLTQSMYIEPFEHAPLDIRNLIEKRLTTSPESGVRAESYKILRKFPPLKISWDINKDLQDKNFELRLSALKYLVYVDSNAAIPALQEKLTDEHWEVRLVAVHRLGRLKAQQSLMQLADRLSDSEWWIKMSAAQALKNFGPEGEKLLKAKAPDLESVPFDASSHISSTLW